MTVNIVALIITMVTAITSFMPASWFDKSIDVTDTKTTRLDPPLTAVQLLWVNLIMDTFAALALATEPPLQALLERPPYAKDELPITRNMWLTMSAQALYQLVVLFVLYYAGIPMGLSNSTTENNCFIFNTFVFCQLFNELNCRKINNELNILENIHHSYLFIIIVAFSAIVQVLIVFFGGAAMQTVPLQWYQWLLSVGIGALCIPYGLLCRFLFRLCHTRAKSTAQV